jgi:PEP-CTERM motif
MGRLITVVCLVTISVSQLWGLPLTSGYILEQNQYRSGTAGGVGVFSVNTGVGSGFVNVWDPTGTNWLVQNLPVSSIFGSSSLISTHFNLGVTDGTRLSTTNLIVDFNTTPNATGTPGNALVQNVNVPLAPFAVGGVDNPTAIEGRLNAPNNVAFNALAPVLELDYQTGHPNVQAAVNQCAPAAVANSLQWLENTYPSNIFVPNDNVPGLKGDNSLVGMLDTTTNRNVVDGRTNTNSSGVWPLDGKLLYLSNASLGGLTIKHQGGTGVDGSASATGGVPNVVLPGTNITRHGITSQGSGTASFDFIRNEIRAGEDVEIDISFACKDAAGNNTFCRHYVNVTGAGTILGVPFITHVSDFAQSDVDPMDNMGTTRIDFDWVTGGNNLPRWGNANIDQVISESVPEPATLAMIGGALIAIALLRRERQSR